MPKPDLPAAALRLGRAEARRFLLAHHRLWPPRGLTGKAGILEYIHHVGCIQYDPVNLVGQNPELVLQARVAGYTPALLAELLYTDRLLLDGWDKAASIHATGDWPHFARYRAHMRRDHGDPANPPMAIAGAVKDALRARGPLCSAELEQNDTIEWWWGVRTRLGRAALEILFGMGEVGVHHRIGTRRYFDLIERLLPAGLLAAADPHATDAAYQDWHVTRRMGGLGIANPAVSQCWPGIVGVRTETRRAVLSRLAERGEVIPVAIAEVARQPLFIRAADLPLLERTATLETVAPAAAFIGPLDNLIWDRELTHSLFDFDYTWEVYKPAAQRQYGHYVLPVLYGDRFVARVEPTYDRKARILTLANWWWEPDARPDDALIAALATCVAEFARYLGAEAVRLGEAAATDQMLAVAAMRVFDRL
jgi:uncharacterized protein YcaQ